MGSIAVSGNKVRGKARLECHRAFGVRDGITRTLRGRRLRSRNRCRTHLRSCGIACCSCRCCAGGRSQLLQLLFALPLLRGEVLLKLRYLPRVCIAGERSGIRRNRGRGLRMILRKHHGEQDKHSESCNDISLRLLWDDTLRHDALVAEGRSGGRGGRSLYLGCFSSLGFF
jgi:hypothetical protein